MFATGLLLLSVLSSIVSVSALPKPEPEQEQPVRRSALPTRWYHKRDHPVHELLKRDSPLPAVGSPQWTANYLQNGALPETNIPQKWLDALHAAEAANLIPNIALATSPDGGNTAVYADPNAGQEPICSAQYQCRHPGDIWDAPDGMIGLSVDDGPVSVQDASNRLYDFLKANNQKVTHFMIGANILYNPDVFLRAFQELEDDIGCHTWTHRHMSLLTNEQLVADLGWTMQIIHDSTGGRVPRYWRPPYGDADNRVRAVAKEIFGLTTVVWNNDSEDWTMASNGTTLPAIQQQFTNWLNGPRTPGLIVLEHEITADDVTAFINMYPLIAQAQGGAPWIATSVAGLFDGHETGWNGEGWYLNSDNDTAPVEDIDIIALDATTTASGPSGTQVGAVNGTHTGTASSTPTTHRNGAAAALGQGASGFTLAGVAVLAGVFSLAL